MTACYRNPGSPSYMEFLRKAHLIEAECIILSTVAGENNEEGGRRTGRLMGTKFLLDRSKKLWYSIA